jgi:moderate conductance mechanosensitive channel
VITWPMLLDWFIQHGIRIIIILAAGVVAWLVLGHVLPHLVKRTIVETEGETAAGIEKRTHTLVAVLNEATRIVIVAVITLMILSEFNIDVGPILAGLGVAGIAVGFGGQYLIRDLISGTFIIWENQYRVGDVVRVADIAGLVEEVTLRKTVLRDLDGIVHHIPNGEVKTASNFTVKYSRVNMNVSVSYGTDLDFAIKVINRVGHELAADENWRGRIITPPQVLRVDKLADSGVELKILGDVQPIEQWNVMGELRLRLKKAFDAEGIEIPWPHTKVYFGNSPSNAESLNRPTVR